MPILQLSTDRSAATLAESIDREPSASPMKLSDRLALANCASTTKHPCAEPCSTCRLQSVAVARELADWLDERFGHSETANLIRGVLPEVG